MSSPSRAYRGAAAHERVAARRERLIDAGIDLFGTVGHRSTTIEQICAQAGLSKRYFYESFSDSEALLLACYQRCAGEIHQEMVDAVIAAPDSMGARLHAALAGYFGAIDNDPRHARITLLEILGVSASIDTAYAAQTERFGTSVRALADEAFSVCPLPPAQLQIIAEGIIGAITTVATQWLLDDRRRARDQVVAATQVLVLAVLERLESY
ncbi:TetR/AcrR family transcriptional regulator [Nocardia sp. NPDC019395]|uniref:TetR/AcrR family transcriptional regulator n=1 Tax=Nocardia sp. NPDC019395 TaxID=3154686 RepID=UPI0033C6F328